MHPHAGRGRKGLLLLALGLIAPGASAQQVERDPLAESPARNPLTRWAQARPQLPEDILVRRLAFAGHGLFVVYSRDEDPTLRAWFFAWTPPDLPGEDDGTREGLQCAAPGVALKEIEPALRRLLASTEWKRHAARLDVLTLECFERSGLYWSLMPVPAGGYQAGVGIPTYRVAFSPSGQRAAAPSLPDVER